MTIVLRIALLLCLGCNAVRRTFPEKDWIHFQRFVSRSTAENVMSEIWVRTCHPRVVLHINRRFQSIIGISRNYKHFVAAFGDRARWEVQDRPMRSWEGSGRTEHKFTGRKLGMKCGFLEKRDLILKRRKRKSKESLVSRCIIKKIPSPVSILSYVNQVTDFEFGSTSVLSFFENEKYESYWLKYHTFLFQPDKSELYIFIS